MNTRTGPRRGPDPAAPAGAAGPADPGAPGAERVAALAYTFGDSAFHVPGFHVDPTDTDLAPIELTGVVHYTAMDPILDGAGKPYAALTTVDFDRHAPA